MSTTLRISTLLCALIIGVAISCTHEKDDTLVMETIMLANDGLEASINNEMSQISAITADNPGKLRSIYEDLNFYYDNTYLMIEEPSSIKDSIRFWRLTKSAESKKYNYNSKLKYDHVFNADTLTRKTALLNNMYHYLKHVYQSFAYCGIFIGTFPVVDTSEPNIIYLYGKPHKSSELDLILKHSAYPQTIPDSIPIWGKLELIDTTLIINATPRFN